MPANLPPQYFEAEKNFRLARDPAEKIAALEEMLAIMPKHKGTDHLRAELRAKIARLSQLAGKKSGTQRTSMIIEREGAAQVAVVGPTNVGKSQLVSRINTKHGNTDWMPIDLRFESNLPLAVTAYKHFDVMLVNSIFDGMNLVAKEAPLVNERDGVLILSENVGAYEEIEIGRAHV